MEELFTLDIYTVINKSFLSHENRNILVDLYQPIIGSTSIMLYFSLWNDLDNSKIMSLEYTHEHLLNNMHITLKELKDARIKLEAVGLLKTYFKEDKVNYYVYELYNPLTAHEFLNHPILNIVLYSNLGKKEYDKKIALYKKPRIPLTTFNDITVSFNEVFESIPYKENVLENEDVRKENRIKFNINSNFDLDFLKEALKKDLSEKAFTKEIEELILNLSFIYKLDTLAMQDIIKGCITVSGTISTVELRKSARNYYTFEHDGYLPTVISKNKESEVLLKDENLKRAKMVYTFETISPYDFLKSKMENGEVIKRDLTLIEDLIISYGLKPKVVNVLIDYVLKTNNNKLPRSLVETIAGQWKRLKIESVVDAMSIAEKEHKKYKKTVKEKVRSTSKKEEKIPEWFDKNVTKQELSVKEKQELEELLKEYKWWKV